MRVGLYIHVFPFANQGRRVIWNGIDRNGKKFLSAFPDELVESRSDLEMRLILKNGSIYQVLGADDPDKLVGINCVGAIFSEYALMDPKAFDLVRPILNENGGWAIFPSTPRGRNHFYDLIHGKEGSPGALKNLKWYVSIETVNTTGAVDPKVIEEDRNMGVEETLIQQEYFCSFDAALQGSYYEKQMSQVEEQKRVTAVPHDSALEVHTAWDLGINDSMSIWLFQVYRGEVRLIHYIEGSGEGLAFYIKKLRDLAEKHDFIYGTHFAPHDIAATDVITGKTRLVSARELGIRFTQVPKAEVEDGIEAVRQILPRCVFDSTNCRRGVEALKSYRKQWDEKLKVYRNKPLHDWASHPADAFRYLAMGLKERNPARDTSARPQSADTSDYSPC